MIHRTIILALALATFATAAPKNPFFAMDNIARGGPDVAPAMLKELGYDGFGGRVPDETMLPAIAARGLKFFNAYHVLELNPSTPAPNDPLRAWLVAMRGKDTVLWLAINKVTRPDGKLFAPSALDADDYVLGQIRAIADVAKANGIRVALYPHTISATGSKSKAPTAIPCPCSAPHCRVCCSSRSAVPTPVIRAR